MAHGNRFSIATHEARDRQVREIQNGTRPLKVAVRMDRVFRERGVRSYRGYSTWGLYFAKLNFHHGFIIIGPFGDLTWRQG